LFSLANIGAIESGGQMGRERSTYVEMRTGDSILIGKPKGRDDFGYISID
jgi:hypothetical protein